jgi:hypothetical protein
MQHPSIVFVLKLALNGQESMASTEFVHKSISHDIMPAEAYKISHDIMPAEAYKHLVRPQLCRATTRWVLCACECRFHVWVISISISPFQHQCCQYPFGLSLSLLQHRLLLLHCVSLLHQPLLQVPTRIRGQYLRRVRR